VPAGRGPADPGRYAPAIRRNLSPERTPVATRTRRRLPALIAAAAALVVPASAAAAGELFVQPAAGGSLERVPGAPGQYLLTLTGTEAVTAFADRPERRAGLETTRRLVSRWASRGFAADPPNAALVVDGAPRGRDVAVFTISRPRLGAGGRTVTFRARRVPVRPQGALAGLHRRADAPVPGRFGRASLFIDPSAAPANRIALRITGDTGGTLSTIRFRPGSTIVASVADTLSARVFLAIDNDADGQGAAELTIGNAGNQGGPLDVVVVIELAGSAPVTGRSNLSGSVAVTAALGDGDPRPLPVSGDFDLGSPAP
jgi:hypothetical protein